MFAVRKGYKWTFHTQSTALLGVCAGRRPEHLLRPDLPKVVHFLRATYLFASSLFRDAEASFAPRALSRAGAGGSHFQRTRAVESRPTTRVRGVNTAN